MRSMLQRILEPEVMDSPEEAYDYDAMDHAAVNRRFVDDLLAAKPAPGDVLDLGTGTAQIPIELCRREPACRVMAADAAISMLEVARFNVESAGLQDRIQLAKIDAKRLGYVDGMFDCVMSNSLLHHLPEPRLALLEAVRVCRAGGLLFFRDLLRPSDEATLRELVATYAGDANEHQKKMFTESLHAALTLDEICGLVGSVGFAAETVQATSDRHWTWCAVKP
jgi:ubiquinone/menaquinone biosynthesis C-methylase UbiE